jgi:hypothetical protein
MPEDDHDLELYWADRGIPTSPPATPDQLREQIAPTAARNDLVIGSRDRPLVIISPDGSLQYGASYTPDEAAMVFWEAMARRRVDFELRMLLAGQMEQILTRVGQRDLDYERMVLRAQAEGLSDTERASREQYAELARGRLEMEVHHAIELGRGLVRRVDPGPHQTYPQHGQADAENPPGPDVVERGEADPPGSPGQGEES